jgi:hypothetical protein
LPDPYITGLQCSFSYYGLLIRWAPRTG